MSPAKNTVCLVVTASNFTTFMQRLRKAQSTSNFVELRIDTIERVTVQHLQEMAQTLTAKAIVTCRPVKHGGHFTGSTGDQNQLLQAANDLGFDYIDIDIAIANEIHINDQRCQSIVSYHDFNHTPTIAKLTQLQHPKADILKIATHCNSPQDAKRLLTLLLNKPMDKKMIVLGMGAAGKITRLLAPLLGGYLTFASLDDVTNELGYIPYEQLMEFYNRTEQFIGNFQTRL